LFRLLYGKHGMSKRIHLQFPKSNETSKYKMDVTEECLQRLCPMLIGMCLCKSVEIKKSLGRCLGEQVDEADQC